MLLHSGRPDPRWARRSVLGVADAAYTFDVDGRSRWDGPPAGFPLRHRPFADLRAVLRSSPGALWVGYLSYDLGRWIERLPSRAAADRRKTAATSSSFFD